MCNFEIVFTLTYQNPKVSRIAEIISSKKYSSICIVIADKLDKMLCEEYWRNYCVRKHSPTIVRVMYPQEYANADIVKCDATIVVGWLNSKNMKNAGIFSSLIVWCITDLRTTSGTIEYNSSSRICTVVKRQL